MGGKVLKLDWDSEFFGFNVGRITIPINDEKDIKGLRMK